MTLAVPRCALSSVSIRIEEAMGGGERQGIGSILGLSSASQKQRNERRESLRRTFSADMSSKNWLAQNLPLSLKKNASIEEFTTMSAPGSSSASSSSEDEEEKEERRKEVERPGQFDIWSSIQAQKVNNSNSPFDAAHVIPSVKRSSSSLSEKSLQICTENLGSETGSDGFSSSEHKQASEVEKNENVLVAVNYSCSMSRKSPPRSFPPPLSSISRLDGPCLQMRPHRRDGHLVLEAIPVPPLNYLHAQRQDGRLRLSFINLSSRQQHSKPVEEEEEEKIEIVVDREIILEVKMKQEEEVMRLHHQPRLVMDKIIGGMHAMHFKNSNPWADKKADGGRDEPMRVPRILAATAFNGYDRCWKDGTTARPAGKSVVLKAKDFLPVMRCKEHRRPAWFGNPFCIPTT